MTEIQSLSGEKEMKSNTACLTGHRPKSLPWGYDEDKLSCIKFKQDIKEIFIGAINYGINTFLTGMAEGFDMIGAEILLELKNNYNIKVVAVIPCLNQEAKWKQSQQKRYKRILLQCNETIVLSKTYYTNCMNDRNKYMVEHSNVCIACWNGKPSGTSNTIRFAKNAGCKVKIIDVNKYY